MATEKSIPKTLKECCQTGSLAADLMAWYGRIQSLGSILMIVLIIAGLIVSIAGSYSTQVVTHGYYYTYTDTETTFSWTVFFTSIATWTLYILMEYVAYNVLSLLLASLSAIVENTSIAANVALYTASKENSNSEANNKSSEGEK